MTDDAVALLERRLLELAPHLDYPPTPDLATAVGDRVRERPVPARRRRPDWLAWPSRLSPAPVALALVLLVTLVLAVSPGARSAVADVLRGVPGIRVFIDERSEPAGAPRPSVAPGATRRLIPGERISLAQARAHRAFALRLPSELGRPDEIYLDTSVRGGILSALWYADARLPQSGQTGVGAVLSEFIPRNSPFFLKELHGTGAQFEFVTVNGDEAAWVEGGHPLEVRLPDQSGADVVVATRLAANTLMWNDGQVTLRLETALPLADATRIAQSVR